MAAPSQVTSAKWLRKIIDFRRNPIRFLNQNGLSESAFVVDIQKELYDEELTFNVKIHLLIILQEYSDLLLLNNDRIYLQNLIIHSVEQCVAPLVDIYSQTPNSSITDCYKAQYLITSTSIMLNRDILDEFPSLFCRVVDLLLDVVSKVNGSDNQQVRTAACLCLEEVELQYPTILLKKLPHLYSLSQLEKTTAAQSYVSLVVTVLRHGVYQLVSGDGDSTPQLLNEMITRQSEALKPLHLGLEKFDATLPIKGTSSTLNRDIDPAQLKRLASFVLDQVNVMTSSTYLHTLLLLVDVVKMAPDFSPIIFKPLLITRLMTTYNIAYSCLVMKLMTSFGERLLTVSEKSSVLKRLVSTLLQPCLTSAQRLIIYEWLLRFPDQHNAIPDSDSIPNLLDASTHRSLFPTVFDGIDTKLKKLNILSLYYKPGEQADLASETLIKCLFCLHQPMHYGVRGKGAINFFRALYILYSRHGHTCLLDDIQRLLFRIAMEQPKFTPHLLDFMQNIATHESECQLSGEVLSLLTNEIVSTPVDNIMDNLLYHLMVLESAAHDTRIYPKPILRFLQNLLDQSNLTRRGDWKLGNALLAIIRSMLQAHDTDDVYAQMGDFLHTMVTAYRDADIQDRAKFLYSLLTRISTEKLSTILLQTPYQRSLTGQSLPNMATGSVPIPVTTIPLMEFPVVKFESVEVDVSDEGVYEDHVDDNLVENYLSFHRNPETDVHVCKTYRVSIIAPDVERIFAVNIKFLDHEGYQSMDAIHLPMLTLDRPLDVQVKFRPLSPVVGRFRMRAVFNTDDGDTMVSDLDPLYLTFTDLFCRLPYPRVLATWSKSKLFNDLWTHIENKDGLIETGCVMSFKKVDCDRTTFSACMEKKRLSHFFVDSDAEEDRYAVFIPPSTSLLLRLTYPNLTSFVRIATDSWTVLPNVDTFLDSLVAS